MNVMRHFLLIPNDEVNGRKMWSLVEMICNQVILAEPSVTTKMKFAEWLPMYQTKNKQTKVWEEGKIDGRREGKEREKIIFSFLIR